MCTQSMEGKWMGYYIQPLFASKQRVSFSASIQEPSNQITFQGSVTDFLIEDDPKRFATINGQRDGINISFIKVYTNAQADPINYVGSFTDEGKLEGKWYIRLSDGSLITGLWEMWRIGVIADNEKAHKESVERLVKKFDRWKAQQQHTANPAENQKAEQFVMESL